MAWVEKRAGNITQGSVSNVYGIVFPTGMVMFH